LLMMEAEAYWLYRNARGRIHHETSHVWALSQLHTRRQTCSRVNINAFNVPWK
jgi:hypothetical protein